jgi:hypothetical protein
LATRSTDTVPAIGRAPIRRPSSRVPGEDAATKERVMETDSRDWPEGPDDARPVRDALSGINAEELLDDPDDLDDDDPDPAPAATPDSPNPI